MDSIEEYSKVISNLPDSFHGVEGVLYSVVLTVVSIQEHHTIHDFEIASDSEWIDFKSNQTCDLRNIKNNSLSSMIHDFQAFYEPEKCDTMKFVDKDDRLSIEMLKSNHIFADDISNEGLPSLSGLLIFIKQALLRRMYPLLLKLPVSNSHPNPVISPESHLTSFPLEPTESTNKRKLRETELLNFSALSSSDFFRYRSLQLLHDMLRQKLPVLPSFTKKSIQHDGEDGSILRRRYYRQLTGLSFMQVIISEMIREPQTIAQYDSWTDELLYILYWKNPGRRIDTEKVIYYTEMISPALSKANMIMNDDKIITPEKDSRLSSPDLSASSNKNKASNAKKSKPTISSDKAAKKDLAKPIPAVMEEVSTIDKEAEKVEKQYGMDQVVLTPAGRALVMIKQYLSSKHAWLTIHTPCKSILGLRPSSSTSSYDCDKINGDAIFFYETEDQTRYTITTAPASFPIMKPDGYGSILFHCMMHDGMKLLASSDGSIKLTCNTQPIIHDSSSLSGKYDLLGYEVSRHMIHDGMIVKKLERGLFRQEILYPDGSRQLFRILSQQQKPITAAMIHARYHIHDTYSKYIMKLCVDAPINNWDSIYLISSGMISYYESISYHIQPTTDIDTDHISSSYVGVLAINKHLSSYMIEHIDAETKATVRSYADGRVISTNHSFLHTTITKCHHHDATITTLINTSSSSYGDNISRVYLIEHHHMPSVEIDLDIDAIARQHTRGMIVPINKGGDRIRCRIAMNDGSALMIKYDTRITAKYNGSIKLVRRDKNVMQVSDDGKVEFKANSSWDADMQRDFHSDCADPIPALSYNHQLHISSTMRQSLLMTPPTSSSPPASPSTRKMKKSYKITTSGSESMLSSSPTRDFFLTTKALDTKYHFYLHTSCCHIEDYEYNIFDINLIIDPLHPIISLAGEVSGLKPHAVADTPIDARIFTIDRIGHVTETMSIHSVSDIERYTKLHPEAMKAVSSAESQPMELNPVSYHSYFTSSRSDEVHRFEDVYQRREWLHIKTPAVVNYMMAFADNSIDKKPNNNMDENHSQYDSIISYPTSSHTSSSRPMMVKTVLIEQLPLSQQGYEGLYDSINRWKQFIDQRKHTIMQYTVSDPRSKEQIDEEAKIQSRLKKAYKVKHKLKKSSHIENTSSMAGGATNRSNVESVTNILDLNGKAIYQPGAKLEGVDELGGDDKDMKDDEDDDSVAFSSDDGEAVEDEVDPEEREILAAFYEYGVEVSSQPVLGSINMSISSQPVGVIQSNTGQLTNAPNCRPLTVDALAPLTRHTPPQALSIPLDVANGLNPMQPNIENDATIPAYLPLKSIQAALIQIFNTLISHDMIRDELNVMGLADMECIYLSEFMALYRRISYRLNPDAAPSIYSHMTPHDDKSIHSNITLGEDDHEIGETPMSQQHSVQDNCQFVDDYDSVHSSIEGSVPGGIAQGAAIKAVRSARK